MMGKLSLRHISFTGPNVEAAGLTFVDGLNILYGASNTGKSFVVEALNFMLGASKPLRGINESKGYDAIWLGIVMPDGQEKTLYRAAAGGAFKLYTGLLQSIPEGDQGIPLNESHDAKSDDNLSKHLLNTLNLSGLYVVKNASGEKDSLSFRYLAPYVFTPEVVIIAEQSPILASAQYTKDTVEKNVFRLLLTGHDDKAIEAIPKQATQKVAREAKLELIDDWIADIDDDLGEAPPIQIELVEQASKLSKSLSNIYADLQKTQSSIDDFTIRRRNLADDRDLQAAHLAELELMLTRFERLDKVYASDIERLQAIEEGGGVMMALAGQPCTVCGAPPNAQLHTHGADEIDRSHKAAIAEINKIQQDRRDLEQTRLSLSSEAVGLGDEEEALEAALAEIKRELEMLRPKEAGTRKLYEKFQIENDEIDGLLGLYERREQLVDTRQKLDVPSRKRPKNDKLQMGITGQTGYAFATTVQKVLKEWKFPGDPTVTFDQEHQDIRLDGKDRIANGKGVRALLHAAFKIAVLIYCDEHKLPHPGFLVIDTPLLTYREPMKNPKHGKLTPDEEALKDSGIATRFYNHLAGLKDICQIIIIENSDPPVEALDLAWIQTFTGDPDIGRFGLFPLQ